MLRLVSVLLALHACSAVQLSLSKAAQLLRVPVGASRADVRSAYRRQAALSHPDVAVAGAPDFLQIQAAYELCLRSCSTGMRERTAVTSWASSSRPGAVKRPWRVHVACREDIGALGWPRPLSLHPLTDLLLLQTPRGSPHGTRIGTWRLPHARLQRGLRPSAHSVG